jgi:N utilization substance protein A
VSEVGEQEKIDIIVWADNPTAYITQALSPTNVAKVVVDEKTKKARVIVPEDQLSIAIGKAGQNVRLASKLTGYELDIEAERGSSVVADSTDDTALEGTVTTTELPKTPKLKKKNELESSLLEAIEEHGEDAKDEK